MRDYSVLREIPDIIEQCEAAMERAIYERLDGDMWTCSCGQRQLLETCHAISPNPNAMPVCDSCLEEFLTESGQKPLAD